VTAAQFLDTILRAVRRRIVTDRVSIRETARQTGISASTVSRFVAEQRIPRDVATLFALADWAGLDIHVD
jgi:DNA invertase Pin-like site-specific DNA recombinase